MRPTCIGLFLIFCIVSSTNAQKSQYEILEDNPYKNMFSINVGTGLRLGTEDETLIAFTPEAKIQLSKIMLTGKYYNALTSLSRTNYEFLISWFFINADEIKIEDFNLRKSIIKRTEGTVTYEILYYRIPMTTRKARGIRLGVSKINHLATTENSTFLVNDNIEIHRNEIVTPLGKYEYENADVIKESQTLSKVAFIGYCSETSVWTKINAKTFGEVITDSKLEFFADILYVFNYTFDNINIHDNFDHIISVDSYGGKMVEPARIDAEYKVKKVFRNFNPWGIRVGLYQRTNVFRKKETHNIRSHFTTTFGIEIGIQPGPSLSAQSYRQSPIRYYGDLKFGLGFSLF